MGYDYIIGLRISIEDYAKMLNFSEDVIILDFGKNKYEDYDKWEKENDRRDLEIEKIRENRENLKNILKNELEQKNYQIFEDRYQEDYYTIGKIVTLDCGTLSVSVEEISEEIEKIKKVFSKHDTSLGFYGIHFYPFYCT